MQEREDHLPEEELDGFDAEERELQAEEDWEDEAPPESEEDRALEEKIALWKGQYPEIFSTVLDEQLYIWRPLNREEYRNMIRRGITEENAQNELVCATCTLWPEDYGARIAGEPAGIPNVLAKAIMNTSGFLVTMDPLRVDLLSDEDIESLDEGLQRVIPSALMQFPKRVYLSIIGNRQFLWRLLTRQEYREMRNSQATADILWMEEKLFRKCVLWPTSDLRSLMKEYAGYGSSISEQVTFQSGFGSEAEIKKL